MFDSLIVKRHLDDLIEKNSRNRIRNIRRTKSESNSNRNEILVEKFDKNKNRNSMLNISILRDDVEKVKNNIETNNILFVNNLQKSLNDNFMQRIQSSTTNPSTPTTSGINSTFGVKINSENAKTNLSMLRFPCSLSLYDFMILIFRLKDTCLNLIKFLIPNEIQKMNLKLFEGKFQTVLCVYKVFM